MRSYQTKEFVKRWRRFDLIDQLANIGSELNRVIMWQKRDKQKVKEFAHATLDLFDLTIDDPRWRYRLKEILRARYLFCDALWGKNEFKTSLQDLEKYFFHYAYYSRNRRRSPRRLIGGSR